MSVLIQTIAKNDAEGLTNALCRYERNPNFRAPCNGAKNVNILRILAKWNSRNGGSRLTGINELLLSSLDEKNYEVFKFAFDELLDDKGRTFAYSAVSHACALGYLKVDDVSPMTWFCIALFHGLSDLLEDVCKEINTETVRLCLKNFRQYIPYQLATVVFRYHPDAVSSLRSEPYKNQDQENELALILGSVG